MATTYLYYVKVFMLRERDDKDDAYDYVSMQVFNTFTKAINYIEFLMDGDPHGIYKYEMTKLPFLISNDVKEEAPL